MKEDTMVAVVGATGEATVNTLCVVELHIFSLTHFFCCTVLSLVRLASVPPIPGLDESIVMLPRSQYLTLGVMSLEVNSIARIENVGNSATLGMTAPAPKTLSMVLVPLTSHRPRTLDIRTKNPLGPVINAQHKLFVALCRNKCGHLVRRSG